MTPRERAEREAERFYGYAAEEIRFLLQSLLALNSGEIAVLLTSSRFGGDLRPLDHVACPLFLAGICACIALSHFRERLFWVLRQKRLSDAVIADRVPDEGEARERARLRHLRARLFRGCERAYYGGIVAFLLGAGVAVLSVVV